ncbi:hypothetical protein ACPPVT_16840 [Angustibacter sp. McL0619]|uniref:hypothetical protein n=1 Tax=Angustibacter sp. McL0619 TaxID=3415676 RepID=UPI003CEBCFE2
MRWERLFEDLEGQLAAEDADELSAEIGERTRLERSRLALADRLLGWLGQPIVAHLVTGHQVAGRLADAGSDWLLVDGPALTLVPAAAVSSLGGLGAATTAPGLELARRRYRLTAVLRAIARDRSPVRLLLDGGATLTGTIDAAGADHFDLAEHPADEPRRPRSVLGVRTVPLASLVTVQPAPGTTSLA